MAPFCDAFNTAIRIALTQSSAPRVQGKQNINPPINQAIKIHDPIVFLFILDLMSVSHATKAIIKNSLKVISL